MMWIVAAVLFVLYALALFHRLNREIVAAVLFVLYALALFHRLNRDNLRARERHAARLRAAELTTSRLREQEQRRIVGVSKQRPLATLHELRREGFDHRDRN